MTTAKEDKQSRRSLRPQQVRMARHSHPRRHSDQSLTLVQLRGISKNNNARSDADVPDACAGSNNFRRQSLPSPLTATGGRSPIMPLRGLSKNVKSARIEHRDSEGRGDRRHSDPLASTLTPRNTSTIRSRSRIPLASPPAGGASIFAPLRGLSKNAANLSLQHLNANEAPVQSRQEQNRRHSDPLASGSSSRPVGVTKKIRYRTARRNTNLTQPRAQSSCAWTTTSVLPFRGLSKNARLLSSRSISGNSQNHETGREQEQQISGPEISGNSQNQETGQEQEHQISGPEEQEITLRLEDGEDQDDEQYNDDNPDNNTLTNFPSLLPNDYDNGGDDDDGAHYDDGFPLDTSPTNLPPTQLQPQPPEEDLVEATPVDDMECGHANPVSPEEIDRKRYQEQKRKKFCRCGYSLIFLALVVLAVSLFIRFTRSEKDPSLATTLPPTASPSSVPSQAPTPLILHLPEELISPHEDEYPRSPQYLAHEWLQNHPKLFEMEDWRRQQLYALGTFFYAYRGSTWRKEIGDYFMTYELHECEWYSAVYGGISYYGSYYEGWYQDQEPTDHEYRVCDADRRYTVLAPTTPRLWNFSLIEPPPFPSELMLLSSLQKLEVKANPLQSTLDPVLNTLRKLLSLEQLAFLGTEIHGTIPTEIGLLPAIRSLRLTSNQLNGTICSEVGQLSGSINELYLEQNRLSGFLPTELALLDRLELLWLNDNQLSSMSTAAWMLPTTLQRLDISNNRFTGPPPRLSAIPAIRRFQAKGNEFVGGLGDSLDLESLSQLAYIDMTSNLMTGNVPTPALTHLADNLTDVLLGSNLLTGNISTQIGKLSNLYWLFLEDNHLSGIIPTQLGLLTRLNRLDLSNNGLLAGRVPSELAGLTDLEELSLAGNSLTGWLPSSIGSMTHLFYLNLSYNFFSGPLPTSLGSLHGSLDLSQNRFAGKLSIVAELTNLKRLDVSSNFLASSIPTEVGLLTKLRSLDLSFNSLRGSIPSELGVLHSSCDIYLVGNPLLEGPLPVELCPRYCGIPDRSPLRGLLEVDCHSLVTCNCTCSSLESKNLGT